MARDIILASASPRRKELLTSLGLRFSVADSGVDETDDAAENPAKFAADLAIQKAEAVASRMPRSLILGADTVVVVDHRILGKPTDDADARRMLQRLRSRWHRVVTGVAVLDALTGKRAVSVVETRVKMASYSDRDIEEYVMSGEPLDKAGSYAIQGLGGRLVDAIEGCYTNVVGLPVCEVARLFEQFGITAPAATPVCRDASGAQCPRLQTSR